MMFSEITIGGAAGGGGGVVSGFIASRIVLWAKDKRNERFERRGEPAMKDRVRSRFEIYFGVIGIATGAGSAANGLSWQQAMIVPAALPFLAALLMVFLTLRQAR